MFFSQVLVVVFLLAIVSFFNNHSIVQADTVGEVQTTVKIAICGNDIKEGGEQCDNNDLNNATCSSLGYDSGALSCTSACEYDTQQCVGEINSGSNGSGGSTSNVADEVKLTAINFTGVAYPNAKVVFYKNATIMAETKADSLGRYDVLLSDISPGVQTFGIRVTGAFGNFSAIENITVEIISEETTLISGTVIPPTISMSETSQPNTFVTFQGSAVPSSRVNIDIKGHETIELSALPNTSGVWSARLSTESFVNKVYTATAISIADGVKSPPSHAVSFVVKDNIAEFLADTEGFAKVDFNNDGKINLVDFSILAYWHGRSDVPEEIDVIKDGEINLRDYSYVAYYWTG